MKILRKRNPAHSSNYNRHASNLNEVSSEKMLKDTV